MFGSIAHIGLTVSDLDRSVAFYRDVLGLEYQGEMKMGGPESSELFQRPGCQARVAYLRPKGTAGPSVELIQFTDVPAAAGRPDLFTTSISELCFGTDHIDAEYSRLLELGVPVLSAPQTFDSRAYGLGVSRALYFRDPDGNILELLQPVG